MGKASGKLTVFFEDPFWVGVFERIEDEKLQVSRVVFGGEPKESEVLEYILKHCRNLRFGPAVETVVKEKRENKKRIRRNVKKEMQKSGIGTKSQNALKLQQEQNKQVRRQNFRAQRQADKLRLFDLKQQKKKEKHKGH